MPRKMCFLIAVVCSGWMTENLTVGGGGSVFAAGEDRPAARQKRERGQWSAEEVQRFLENSPWAKTVKIPISIRSGTDPRTSQSPDVVAPAQWTRFESCCRSFELPSASSNADSSADPAAANSLDFSRGSSGTWTVSARIFWMSSVSVRRALIRQRQLQGIPMERAEAALAPSSELVLGLSGSFLKLLDGLSPGDVQRISSIRADRGSKRTLPPAEYVPAQPGAAPTAFLIFPKTLDGKPLFSREDESVTLLIKGIDFKLECQFPLAPMFVDAKLDW